MGCDIHCYIEYKKPDYDTWRDFGGRINPGRNYALFAKLAGVRSYEEINPAIPPRGFPNDAAWEARWDNRIFVSETEGEGYVKPDTAVKWVESGISKWMDDEKKIISHPDWHSHSWLTPDEFAEAIDGHSDPEYMAILAAMRSFESQGMASRLVFWFDN